MASKKSRVKNVPDVSVEGSRALEPQVVTEDTTHVTKSSRISSKTLATVGVILVLLLLIASLPAYYFFNQYNSSKERLKDPTTAAENQIKAVTMEVGKLLLLPTNEAPTLATVSDKSKLAGQAFFAHAENGDKVLIYTNAKKAILYRPSLKKIIEVGPINITGSAENANGQVAGASTSATPTPAQIKVALLNGTTVVGLTKKVEQSLVSKLPEALVTVKDNAVKSDYAETVIISLTPAGKAGATALATTLQGKVSTLPEGETAPTDVDVLVILGQTAAK